MTQQEIEKIIIDTNADEWTKPAKEIYKLHLEDEIKLLESVLEHPTKPGYKRHDIIEKIKILQQELKTLEE